MFLYTLPSFLYIITNSAVLRPIFGLPGNIISALLVHLMLLLFVVTVLFVFLIYCSYPKCNLFYFHESRNFANSVSNELFFRKDFAFSSGVYSMTFKALNFSPNFVGENFKRFLRMVKR